MASFRSLLRQVLHLHESPHRTALAFAIGACIAFCPFYGFHMILVGLCAWIFGLNLIALLAGALFNNPWTIVPILGATYWTGAPILGQTSIPSFDWHDLSFRAHLRPSHALCAALHVRRTGVELHRGRPRLSTRLSTVIKKYRQAQASAKVEPLPPHNQAGLR